MYLERERVEKYKVQEKKPGVKGLDFQDHSLMKRKLQQKRSLLAVRRHEGLPALTQIHTHPETSSPKTEATKEKHAINAK